MHATDTAPVSGTPSSPSAAPSGPADRVRRGPRRLLARGAAALGATALLGVTVTTGSASAIVNGEDATRHYPFMATVPVEEYGAQCGATLVDKQWVLTAAHCVNPELATLTGKIRVGSDHRTTGGSVRNIDKVVTAPGYVQDMTGTSYNKNDLALIRLDRPVSQKPVRIADKPGPVGTPTRILGYGTVVEAPSLEDAKFPNRLQQLDTRRGAVSECAPGWAGKTRLCTVSPKPKAMACNGDSGGPQLQRGKNGRWELIGATSGPGSLREGCGTGPGLYSNVPAFKSWIHKTIHKSG
ncbi:S1 family peptidase [Streptomyces longispororuber]|uniref:S1 family peptidase n=1 Tax=Streptomyces longispororuber TaxID=68230 RepID=UPI0037006A8A